MYLAYINAGILELCCLTNPVERMHLTVLCWIPVVFLIPWNNMAAKHQAKSAMMDWLMIISHTLSDYNCTLQLNYRPTTNQNKQLSLHYFWTILLIYSISAMPINRFYLLMLHLVYELWLVIRMTATSAPFCVDHSENIKVRIHIPFKSHCKLVISGLPYDKVL